MLYVLSVPTVFTYAHGISSFFAFPAVSLVTDVFMRTCALGALHAFEHGGMINDASYYFHVLKLCAFEKLFIFYYEHEFLIHQRYYIETLLTTAN